MTRPKTRLPFPDPAAFGLATAAQLDRTPSIVVRMMAHASEAPFLAFNGFSGIVGAESSLAPALREVAILRVGTLSRCDFEVDRHRSVAREAGLTDTQIADIEAGGVWPTLNETERAVAAFTDDLVKHARPDDARLHALRALIGERGVMDLVLLIGCYMMVARVIETAGITAASQNDDWLYANPDGEPRR